MDSLNIENVEALFANLASGDSDRFFQHVADDVHWTVMGTHPLAGSYTSKADFFEKTFGRLNKLLVGGVSLRVDHIIVSGDEAAVEMASMSIAKNGKPFDNTYCWIVRFMDGVITEVRAYVDSVVVQRVIDENE